MYTVKSYGLKICTIYIHSIHNNIPVFEKFPFVERLTVTNLFPMLQKKSKTSSPDKDKKGGARSRSKRVQERNDRADANSERLRRQREEMDLRNKVIISRP